MDVGPDGDILISARNTCALYDIDRTTGAVNWRLGGKRSDFRIESSVPVLPSARRSLGER